MSMMTTAQSDIAADLDAFAEATWFTSAYLVRSPIPSKIMRFTRSDRRQIAASSVTPLTGRLSEIFTPRLYVIFSSILLSIGLFITAAAPTLAVFLLGRVVSGCGSAGLMSTSIILALDLSSPKRRGLCIGLINCGFTTGVASGAVLAGILTPTLGWVSTFDPNPAVVLTQLFSRDSFFGSKPRPHWSWDLCFS